MILAIVATVSERQAPPSHANTQLLSLLPKCRSCIKGGEDN